MKRFSLIAAIIFASFSAIASAQTWRFVDGTLRPVYNGNPVTLGSHSTADALRILEPSASGSNYTAFQQPALAANLLLKLPTAYATANGQVLSSTTAGDLSWATVESGITIDTTAITGGGANRILFESGTGKVTSSAGLTFDGTNLSAVKLIGGTATTSDLTLQTTTGVGATGADMHFLVGNNGATEAMTILNNGNVGIGTTSPSSKLSVSGSAAQIAEFVSSNLGNSYFLIKDGSATPVESYYGVFGGGLSFQSRLNTGAAYPIRFINGNDESVRIDTAGNVGINTTTPGAQLHTVAGSATTIGAIIQGAASQIANLQEWQESAGTTFASIGPTGTFTNSIIRTSYINNKNNTHTIFTFTDSSGNAVFNDDGAADADFRIEGDTNANLFFVDASLDSIAMGPIYLGNGITSATPTAGTLNGTGGLGTNIAGAALNIAGGKGTGTGLSGVVNIQTAPAGLTGSTLNALVTAASFDASTVSGNTRMFLYDVDNATLERVTVGIADSAGVGYKVLRIPN